MTDTIIGPPRESPWSRVRGGISKVHPTVWAAVIAGVFGLLGLWLGSYLRSGKLLAKVDALTEQVTQREKVIQEKTAEIQRLETLLAPFRTIAVQRYAAPEPEALRKLAHRISEIESSVEPRSLSAQQKQTLSAMLAKTPVPQGSMHIVSRMMDGEAKDYSLEIADVFRKAGWNVTATHMLGADTVGLGVCSYMSESKLPGHDLINSILVAAGIPCGDVSIPERTSWAPLSASVILVVGRRK